MKIHRMEAIDSTRVMPAQIRCYADMCAAARHLRGRSIPMMDASLADRGLDPTTRAIIKTLAMEVDPEDYGPARELSNPYEHDGVRRSWETDWLGRLEVIGFKRGKKYSEAEAAQKLREHFGPEKIFERMESLNVMAELNMLRFERR